VKNQYFGDINDYRKYGLLRSILRVADIRLLVAWMLTPDDGSTDGKFLNYLKDAGKWSKHDPELYNSLQGLVGSATQRGVSLIEQTDLLVNTEYYSQIVPDLALERSVWFESLQMKAQSTNFIFLDPDNGLEIKSIPYGRKNSSKFLYWHEVDALWKTGNSLLIYQHFIREKRNIFITRMLEQLNEHTHGSIVEAFSTSNVLFLMALQPKHQKIHSHILDSVKGNWEGQIDRWVLASTSE